jgi:cellulose synthase operon protein YhjQ
MPLVMVTSVNGGAGKTMLTANLAVGLRSVGWRVLAVDFNPQDSLKLHFGLDPFDGRGFAAQMLAGASWEDSVYGAEAGIDVMPFGRVRGALSGSVAGLLAADTDRVVANLAELATGRMVLVDAPSMPSAGTRALLAAANVVIVATATDAGSYAALSLADADSFLGASGVMARTLVVANFYDEGSRLQRGIRGLLDHVFGAKLAAIIERDDLVDEALASRRPVLLHDHSSKAARGLVALAIEVDRLCAPNGELH